MSGHIEFEFDGAEFVKQEIVIDQSGKTLARCLFVFGVGPKEAVELIAADDFQVAQGEEGVFIADVNGA